MDSSSCVKDGKMNWDGVADISDSGFPMSTIDRNRLDPEALVSKRSHFREEEGTIELPLTQSVF